MDADSWAARLSSASKRYQAALHSRSDLFMGFDEIEEDDLREEFACPFCSEYLDIVGLCCHIDDEHPVESKNGICPVCSMRVGIDMVAHITLQHGNIFKMQRKRRATRKGGGGGGSVSTLSLLRRELRDGNLQSLLLGGSSSSSSASSCPVNAGPDPLLSSFIMPMVDNFGASTQPSPLSISKKITNENVSEERGGGGGGGVVQCSHVNVPPLSIKDQEEKSRRSEFVQGMLMSTIFGDDEDDDML
ncbi:protein DEHYDRATION-INDUCED 19 homolog 3-like isoform X2 [Impatiens glandulifera]|uniref:protein DEHYDRATION-INDUCED 19 homolog 3-like isoform X2 n=1 Tax=Impatiens glandulifera TaxID=253017 RepID=UPI001FB0704D|nr:protein DEHYDRATION-INDUCED 19 homolog 3-like isoform X2 [Impatiens glandulifera]